MATLLTGCGSHGGGNIVGKWRGNITSAIVSNVEYKSNGTMATTYTTPSGTISTIGSYTITGDSLTQTTTKILSNTSTTHVQVNVPVTVPYSASGTTLSINHEITYRKAQ